MSRSSPPSALAQPAAHWTIAGAATHELQSSLPSLPLPPLADTLRRYLDSCRPLLTAAEFAATEFAVTAFASETGPLLQRQLEERAQACVEKGTHWLAEWWDHYAYLSCRVPLPVKWNIFGTALNSSRSTQRLRRAARLALAAASFHVHLAAGRIAPDSLDTRGNIPLCMEQV